MCPVSPQHRNAHSNTHSGTANARNCLSEQQEKKTTRERKTRKQARDGPLPLIQMNRTSCQEQRPNRPHRRPHLPTAKRAVDANTIHGLAQQRRSQNATPHQHKQFSCPDKQHTVPTTANHEAENKTCKDCQPSTLTLRISPPTTGKHARQATDFSQNPRTDTTVLPTDTQLTQ